MTHEPDSLPPEALADVVALLGEAQPAEPATPIGSAWRAVDPSWLTDAPPPRDWLLRHPTRDGRECPPGEGDGLLCRGRVGLLAAEGGAGKTGAVVQFGVSLVSGRPWLGHFGVDWAARSGRVLLALAEEDEAECRRLLYRVAQSYRLTDAERDRVARQIVVMPLAGQPVALVRREGDAVVASPVLRALRARLDAEAGEQGWSLVGLDPLARWAGLDAESSNEVATRMVQALETLTEAHGRPTVLVAHHSSKLARRTGTVDARGVTALTDAARWHATLRVDREGVYFRQEKSNYSRPMPDELRLVRDRWHVLRVPTADELGAEQHRAEVARADALESVVAAIVAVVKASGGSFAGGQDALSTAAGVTQKAGRAAYGLAIARGLLLQRGTTRDKRLELGEAAHA